MKETFPRQCHHAVGNDDGDQIIDSITTTISTDDDHVEMACIYTKRVKLSRRGEGGGGGGRTEWSPSVALANSIARAARRSFAFPLPFPEPAA